MTHLLSSLSYAPLAGALAVAAVPREQVRLIRAVATLATTATAVLSLILWFAFQPRGAEWQFTETLVQWPSVGASYSVGVDGLGVLFVAMTAIACWIAGLGSWSVIQDRVKDHYIALLTLETALLVAFTSLDLLLWAVVWVVATVATWRLARAGRLAIVMTSIATIGVLVGVVSVYVAVHSLASVYTFDVRMLQHITLTPRVQHAIVLTFALGFGIAAGLFPLHAWQRHAQVEAPIVVSFLLAGVVAKLGMYGFLRIALPILPAGVRFVAPAMVALSMLTVVVGTVMAYWQTDWKRIAAYVHLSIVGLMVATMFQLAPMALTDSVVAQLAHVVTIGGLYVTAEITRVRDRERLVRPVLRPLVALLAIACTVLMVQLGERPLQPTIETSVARVILRVNPERASEVSDCLTNPQAPPKVDPGLPAGMSAMAPCTDEKPAVPK